MDKIIPTSPPVKGRDSNIELLRILSILLVMILHANYLALEPPSQAAISSSFGNAFIQVYIEALSCVCVNIFILISGWFGIRFKIIRLAEIVFQVLFICIAMYILLRVTNLTKSMDIKEWSQLFFIKSGGYWFVRAYIILYVFAPVLNTFVENCSRNQIKIFIFLFFILQSIYGFYHSDVWFSEGYSPLSFMGLYVIARFMRIYPNHYMKCNRRIDISIYFVTSAFTAICAIFLTPLSAKGATIMFLYSSPLVIIASMYIFLFFTKIQFYNCVVNWIASSSFAVYLLHCSPHVFQPIYLDTISHWHETESVYLFISFTIGFIIVIFSFSIMLDKFRLKIWDIIVVCCQKISHLHNERLSGSA